MRRSAFPGLVALGIVLGAAASSAYAETPGAKTSIDARIAATMPQVIAWRRDIHEHPELGNREIRTSRLVADHLRSLGLEVRTGLAHTGVVGVLRGRRAGPVIALRADMDALPVTEETDVPFRSVVKTEYRGEQVGVMHACGHDGHTAILMGVAQVLAGLRDELSGTVLFVFQPAEEGAPDGEQGGATLMLEENALDPRPEAMFGLHLWSTVRAGEVAYRPGPTMAGSDRFRIAVHGRQTHGGQPWRGVDPIVAAAQIVTSLQAVVSRQTDITQTPVVVTVGSIKGGIRFNIIPDSVEMLGTIRTYDAAVREQTIARVRNVAENAARANGATATLEILPGTNVPLINDATLTARILPSLQRAVGRDRVVEMPYVTAAEDFAWYAAAVPAFFLFVGVTPPDRDPATVPANHSPLFFLDERGLDTGVRSMLGIALGYLGSTPDRT
jgi:amidohydrolase